MVTFVPAGRMGNFLFEAATALSYALKHGLDFSTPNRTNDPKWNPLYLEHLINPSFNSRIEKIDLWENGHQWQPIPFEENWRGKNIYVHGYRQTELYFKEHRREILSLFEFPYEKKTGHIACHVRRGDYVTLREKHPELTVEWYEQAMAMFPNHTFKFFSDDIPYCREKFGHRSDCEFSSNATEYADMAEMSCFEHQIWSASTFSWWGMWLNRNPEKKVIFPQFWFTPNWCNLITDDIVPSWCIKL
jgi:hypothetical protein